MSLKIGDTTETVSGNSLEQVAIAFRQIVKDALADPGELTADGRFVSFVTPGDQVSTKPGKKAGYACIDPLRFIAVYGSHRLEECPPVVMEIEIPGAYRPTQADREELIRQANEQRTQNAEEAAQRAQAVWTQCEIDLRQHPYLAARGVLDAARNAPKCVRLFPKNQALVIPMADAAGKMWNREAVSQDGRKKFLEGGRIEGLGLWVPGPPTAGQRWYTAEGFAKSLAVYAATGLPCLCCFTAGNVVAALGEHCSAILSTGTIAADSDPTGKKVAEAALQRFQGLRVVYPPDGAGDWNDVLTQQGMDALKAALAQVEPSTQEPPAPLRREPPDPEPFPMDALGPVLSAAASAMQQIIQAPDALLGQSVLGAASLAVQAHANVIIDGRISPLSLFFLTIAASGERKSATDTVALKPVMEKQRELVALFRDDLRLHKADVQAFEKAERDLIKEKVVELSDVRQNRDAKKAALDALGDTPQPPLLPNLLAADPTSEGLFKLFEKGQPSLGLFSDEAGLLMGGAAMMKESRLRMIAALSKLWDGRPLDRVRSVDGSTLLFDRRLALHLMAQPLVAAELFTDPIFADQGFLSRVLCAWPASTAGNRHYLAADLSQDSRIVRYWDCLKSHLNRPYSLRENTRNELTPRNIPLAPAAKAVWIQYVNCIEKQLGDGQVLEPVRGFASKAGDHAARIAGVRTLIQDPDAGDIGTEAIEAGICLMDFYLTEALRIQSTGISDPDLSLAAKCLRWLQTSGITAVYPALIYQYGPAAIRDSDTAKRMIALLEKHRWLIRVQGGGKADGAMRRELWNVVAGGGR